MGRKGSITVEAAIAVPVFICVIASIIFFIKVIYVQEVIQHAISETANQISTYSYLYSISGMQKLNDKTEDEMGKSKEKLNQQMTTLIDTYDCFSEFKQKVSQDTKQGVDNLINLDFQGVGKEVNDISQSLRDIQTNAEKSEEVVNDILKNPKEELKLIAIAFAQCGMESMKTELVLKPIAGVSLAKYIGNGSLEEADKRLKKLNVIDGFAGLDFSQSRLFEDKKNIDLIVKYKMKLSLPINLMTEMHFVQRVKVKAWLNGEDGMGGVKGGNDIWLIDELERGKQIQRIYGRNLPEFFKTVTKFENGTATLVTSINLNSKTYQCNSNKVVSLINKAANDLAGFEGGRQTVSQNGKRVEYYIGDGDIRERCLIVVIPRGSRTEKFENIFSKCMRNAKLRGVRLLIEEL